MARLDGKTALVTGGAGGFGAAMARLFTAEGAEVILTDHDERALHDVAGRYGCDMIVHDVADEARWDEVIAQCEARHGKLDILVNNAGFEGSMAKVDPETAALDDFRKVMQINVEGVFLGCRAAIPAMRRAGGGSIINISSLAGLIATPFQTAYGASKACVRQLTMTVAAHGAGEGIRCNAIHPGQMRTRMIDDIYTGTAARLGKTAQEAEAEFAAMIPMGHLGTAEDIAWAAVYLASDESRYMTGSSLVVDGGSHVV